MSETTTPDSGAAVPSSKKRWYTVQVYSSMEKAVQRALQERIEQQGMSDKFGRTLVPTENVSETKDGKKMVVQRRLFPSYVFVEMEMDDETWHLVKNTQKVTGFIGGTGNKPMALPQREVDKLLALVQEGSEHTRPKVLFEVGETVRVKDGPFTDFNGTVEDVNGEKARVRVSVTIFGRATPVELEFGQVEKV
jgi:transcriptional antiterminator NusG